MVRLRRPLGATLACKGERRRRNSEGRRKTSQQQKETNKAGKENGPMKKVVAAICAMVLAGVCLAQENAHPKVAALTKKLDSITIPTAEFRGANVADVVQFLTAVAKENDPDKAGVNIVLMDKENKSKVTLTLQKASLHKILKLVGEMAGLSVDVEEDAVVLRKPKDEKK